MVSFVLVSLLLSAAAKAIPADTQPHHVRLDFNVYRGDSREDIIERRQDVSYVKRDSASVSLINQQSFYLVDLLMGSQQDKVGVLIDTGSSDLWMVSHEATCGSSRSSGTDVVLNQGAREVVVGGTWSDPDQESTEKRDVIVGEEWAYEKRDVNLEASWLPAEYSAIAQQKAIASRSSSGGNSCTLYGSFNTGLSTSFKRNALAPAFNILYADQLGASGIWATDDVVVGNVTVNGLLFAVANATSSNVGVLGIGLMTLEVTYHSSGSVSYTYENLPIKLKRQGTISKALYSLYLNKAKQQYGTLLFGAIDAAKFEGELNIVPIVSAQTLGTSRPMRLEVAMGGVGLSDSSTNLSILTNQYAALLDLGTTFSYMSLALLTKIGQALNGRWLSSLSAYIVSCTVDPNTFMTFDFSGKTIKVPLSDLVVQYSTLGCFLLILEQTGSYLVFGDNILRSMYLVYDLDDYEISIAQAKYTDAEDIQVVLSTIPGAVRAPNYLSTSIQALVSEPAGTSTLTQSGTQYTCGILGIGRCKKSAATTVHAESLLRWAYILAGSICALAII